MPRSHLPL
uniref:Uncharacterized protein n=1 Tax=Anguilla anguilla TaxID=7936 RepID=A0A0E9RTL1_ANGAN